MSVFRFREFQYDSIERRLTRNGEWVELTPKAMDILEVFVERPGELITRDEIIGKVWSGTLVEEGNLSVHISKLRKALGENSGLRYIETIPGLGYRFTSPLRHAINEYPQGTSPKFINSPNGNRPGTDREALRLLEKGRLLFKNHTLEDVARAIKFFEKSLALDPGNLNTYWELLSAMRFLHFLDHLSIDDLLTNSAPLLEVMSELGGGSDIFHLARGEFELYCRWDFEKALTHFTTAVKTHPSNVRARCRLAYTFIYTRQFSKAIQIIPAIVALDPFSIKTCLQIVRFHYQMGNFGAAMSCIDEALEIEPENFEARLLLGTTLAESSRLGEAVGELKRSLELNPHLETVSMLGYVHALKGERNLALSYLASLSQNRPNYEPPLTYQARIWFALGEKEMGYKCLERSVSKRESELVGAWIDPRWRPVRRSARFQSILSRIVPLETNAPLRKKQPPRYLEEAA